MSRFGVNGRGRANYEIQSFEENMDTRLRTVPANIEVFLCGL